MCARVCCADWLARIRGGSMLRYGITEEKPVRPERLQFCTLSAEEIRALSVVQVTETNLYYRGLPASGGLLDSLMGSVDRRHLCASCMRDARTCQGHCGHLELAFPVFHFGFVDATLKTLRTLCFTCSRVCATEEEAAHARTIDRKSRLVHLHTILRTRKTCPHCGFPRPTYTRSSYGIDLEWAADTAWENEEEREYCEKRFTAREALSILKHMPACDVELLGFHQELSHPRSMILQNMIVPPPCTRPAIYSSEGSRSRGQNDLTVRLLEILRRSSDVQAVLGENVHWEDAVVTPELYTAITHLQYEAFVYVNNSTRIARPPAMGRSSGGQNAKSISSRLKGKEGRVRGNLMGKRVDFSARCVITPDAYFECDRVGIPYSIAMTLTIPEAVNASNMQTLAQRVRTGSSDVRGAATVLSTSGVLTDLSQCTRRDDIKLQPGDVVERFLADDDFVVFNRQPSLHMHGMQCHRVRLIPGHTFSLNLVVAAPYNADFDGDEMNVHVPQSKAAMAECAALMGVAQNCVGAQSNRPVMGIVQDSLLGLHLLTQSDVLFDHAHACRLLGGTQHCPKRLPEWPALTVADAPGGDRPQKFWTGRQMFSCLLPCGMYVEPDRLPAFDAVDRDSVVLVRDGQLLHGELRKCHVGTSAGGIVDVMCRDFGNVATMRFMADAQRITHAFLLQRGHHVGIEDVLLSKEGHARVTQRLEKASRLCEEIQREMQSAPRDTVSSGEHGILRLLSRMLLQTGGIVNESMGVRNAIRRMVTAGSKGSFINLSQICATLGQQSLEGGRIVAEKGSRTLPCFGFNDTSLESRGMVFNSFALGLSPPELFYHAIGGREGLVDTAVKTSQTGYLQRRLNKSMEDHVVHADGTVRNSLMDIISFTWGSDGMHPTRVERVRLPVLLADETELRARFDAVELAQVRRLRARIMGVKAGALASEVDLRVLLPFHPSRIAQRVRREAARSPSEPRVARAAARSRLAELQAATPSDVVSLALVDTLAWQVVCGLTDGDHARLAADLRARIDAACMTVGESVGCLAAQSVGEPATQMTLNTFHSAGVCAKNVTLGIPRLKELLDASKQQKTPCTTLRFKSPYSTSRPFADYVANTMALTRLTDVVRECDILRATDDAQEDPWALVSDSALRGEAGPAPVGRYVVSLHLDQELMKARELTPVMVKNALVGRLQARAQVTSSETNCLDWIVRVRFRDTRAMVEHAGIGDEQEAVLCHRVTNVLLETLVVSGHPSVPTANVAEANRHDSDGGSTSEFVVHAYGSVLTDCTVCAALDFPRCTSNDIWEVYELLGIEACAHVFYDQICAVVSFDGTYVDERHLILVVDTVMRNGTIMPLNRHGINRSEQMPLMRCSFEETMDVLSTAALFAEEENARGVTTSIMLGQISEFGTGGVDVQVRRQAVVSQKARQRVLRSTCRSHTRDLPAECIEYVCGAMRHSPVAAVDPMEAAGEEEFWNDFSRRRVRFRPSSPPMGSL